MFTHEAPAKGFCEESAQRRSCGRVTTLRKEI
jgi:hypothetical protein